MNQIQRVEEYLDRFGSISSLEAFRDLGITRLAARISDIRSKKGFDYIDQISESSENRYGEPTTYTVYFRTGDCRWEKRQGKKGKEERENSQTFSKIMDTMLKEGSSSVD